jgi:hypothetical protein
MECRDPRVYGFDPNIFEIEGLTSGNGFLENKGDYPAPLNFLLQIDEPFSGGSITFVGANTNLSIVLPLSNFVQTLRYSAREKIVTLEKQGVEVLRNDLLSFTGQVTHPLVQRGLTAYTWTTAGSPDFLTGSRFWHYDAWA